MPVTITHSTPADGTFSATGATAWNATHTVSGLGTMAEQNANNVNITGGSITGVTGVLSSLTVNSTPTSGGAAGQIMFDTGSVLQESSNLVWDNTNKALNVTSVANPVLPTLNVVGGSNVVGTTLTGVSITGTAGQFSCNATSLTAGQFVTISGTFGGTGSISGYGSPQTYLISATNGSTTFTLVSPTTGAALVTTSGTPTGLTYAISSPTVTVSQAWNNSNIIYNGLRLNVTDTASSQFSSFINLLTNGVERFRIDKTGSITIINAITGTGANISGMRYYITTAASGGFIGRNDSSSFTLGAADDVAITRRGAANLRFGYADAAAPVAQTLSVQSVVAGTSNTAGANLTITGSQGTGTGAGGSIIFQVAPAGSSGTAQNALTSVATLAPSGTGGSLTLTGGTVTTSQPVLDMSQTWNAAGVTFTGLKFNVTNTASAAASTLMDLQVGGSSIFQIVPNNAGAYIVSTTALGSLSGGAFVTSTSFLPNGSDQRLGAFFFSSVSGGTSRASGLIAAYSASAWTDGASYPTYFGFFTTSSGSTTRTERLRILSTGNTNFGANLLSFGSSVGSEDLFLRRRGAANIALGAADAAAPVAQTLSVQSVVAGTSNTAGANLTITGSQGTGTGAGGSIIFQVAPAGTSGTAQNALTTALTLAPSSASGGIITHAAGALANDTSAYSLTATMSGGVSGNQNAVNLTITGGGNTALVQNAFNLSFNAGYVGSSTTNGISVVNANAGTSAVYSAGVSTASYRIQGNSSYRATTNASTSGINSGGVFQALNSTTANYGVWSSATWAVNSSWNVGVAGFGLNTGTGTQQVGGFFALYDGGTSAPNLISAALVADNGSTSSPVFLARVNAVTAFQVGSTGLVSFGSATSSFPALKRSTTILQVRLADDSAYAPVEASTVRTATAYTVATLPAAGTAGRRAYVTDATAPTFLGALIGGGTVVCPVFDDGAAWVAG